MHPDQSKFSRFYLVFIFIYNHFFLTVTYLQIRVANMLDLVFQEILLRRVNHKNLLIQLCRHWPVVGTFSHQCQLKLRVLPRRMLLDIVA